jgi:FtsZ-interacting cell division protein ZipA
MNWPVIIIVGIIAIALIAFLTWRNFKDEKEFEQQLKDDYHHSKDEEGDTDAETQMK